MKKTTKRRSRSTKIRENAAILRLASFQPFFSKQKLKIEKDVKSKMSKILSLCFQLHFLHRGGTFADMWFYGDEDELRVYKNH